MHQILKNTHKQENIDLLRARDFYFDKARSGNFWKKIIMIVPVVVLIISYLPIDLIPFIWLGEKRDIVVGVLTVTVFCISIPVDAYISRKLEISNMLREEYDCNVFEIAHNPFLYDTSKLQTYLEKSKTRPYLEKYEHWYSEIFSDDINASVLCSQADNIIYTYHAYDHAFYIYLALTITLACVLCGAAVGMAFIFNGFTQSVLIILACFEIFRTLLENMFSLKNGANSSKKLKELIENKQTIDANFIRYLQDCIAVNRNNSCFIPKLTRNKYLKDVPENKFYIDLNKIKALYLGKDAYIPSSADDIEILSLDGKRSITLTVLHDRLRALFVKMKEVLDADGITYTLDGGTLIGAMREGVKGFIFWDDDIDIAIPASQLEAAKRALIKAGMIIQDCENDEYYSPRLSEFRVREPNDESVTYEKDSVLYDLYKYRGIFIDVYSYTPVLKCRFIDRLYRRIFLHGINKRIKKTENNCILKANGEKYLKKFKGQKRKYLRRKKWYLRHAKNEKYFVYTPQYVENLKKAGPYIKAEDLYKKLKSSEWEGIPCSIPARPEAVLEAYYGKWQDSPFKTIDEYIREIDEENDKKGDGKCAKGEVSWYSKCKFFAASMKHIKYVELVK